MKSIMSALVVMIMVFALVSIGEVRTCSLFNDNPRVFYETNKAPADAGVKDADLPGQLPTGNPCACSVQSPASPDYIDTRQTPCDRDDVRLQVPMIMGIPY